MTDLEIRQQELLEMTLKQIHRETTRVAAAPLTVGRIRTICENATVRLTGLKKAIHG